MKIERAGSRKYFALFGLALLVLVWAVAGRAAGPSAENTVRFLDQKFKAYGGGFAMDVESDQRFGYTRIFPVSISMPDDGLLILEVAEQSLIEDKRLPEDEIDPRLAGLSMAGARHKRYEIPLGKMDFGGLSNRRGDWPARKTLKKASGKIRALCQDKLDCIKVNQLSEGHYVDLYVADAIQREKIFNALKHLIGLYQHRRELF